MRLTRRGVPGALPARAVACAVACAVAAAACDRLPGAQLASADPAWVARADSAARRAMADTTQWADYGRDYSNQSWSPLAQITAANVGQLRLAWVHHSGLPHASQSSPVMVDGTLYLSTALNNVVALDARTGAERWRYVHSYRTTVNCCSTVNRGVTVYGGRVYMGTVDARLVALDAATGAKLWDVAVGDPRYAHHITFAPLAARGRIITGVSGGESGCRCYVDAYDAATGRHVWRWYSVPTPEEGGWWGTWKTTDPFGTPLNRDVARERRDSARWRDAWKTGGGSIWNHPAYDAERETVIVNVGNPAPDLDGGKRPGDNLYTESLVALDVNTGRMRWHFQMIPHDLWDYDPSSPPVLVDIPDASGQMVPAVVEAGKTGWVYMVDRRDGRPIRRSDAVVPQGGMFTAPTFEGVMVTPGTLGGVDWSPAAYSPATGFLYVDGNYLRSKYKLREEELRHPAEWWGGVVVTPPEGHYGLISAVDLRTGRVAWQTRTAEPLLSGMLATAGGVVFTGLSDQQIAAYDARTGQQLWSFDTPAGVNAPTITYMLDGVQYVAAASTGTQTLNTPRGDALLVFALPPTGRIGPQVDWRRVRARRVWGGTYGRGSGGHASQ